MPADLALDLGVVYSNLPSSCNHGAATSVLHITALVGLVNEEVLCLHSFIRVGRVLRNLSGLVLEVA